MGAHPSPRCRRQPLLSAFLPQVLHMATPCHSGAAGEAVVPGQSCCLLFKLGLSPLSQGSGTEERRRTLTPLSLRERYSILSETSFGTQPAGTVQAHSPPALGVPKPSGKAGLTLSYSHLWQLPFP